MIVSPKKIISSRFPRKLKWGVVACNVTADNFFLPALQLTQRGKLVSVFCADIVHANSISSKFMAPNSFDNFEKFLNSDIDSVYLSGKVSDHYNHIIKCAQAGKNILCEKPLALNSTDAKKMIEECEKHNVILLVNYAHRFHPLVQKAKELVDNQLLGKIISISSSYHIDLPPDDAFHFRKELCGGGVLRDIGSLIIDLIRYFGGEIENIKAFTDNIVYKSDVEDFASGVVRFEKGGYGNFSVSYDSKKSSDSIEIVGYKGTLTIENIFGRKSPTTKLIIDLKGEGKKVFKKRITKYLYVVRAVQKTFTKKEASVVSAEDALINIKLIEEIEKQCLLEKNL